MLLSVGTSHRCCFWLLVAAIIALAVGCAKAKADESQNLAFRHILADELEAIGYVTAIAQDEQGFMWFGGSNGLARFNGYELEIYRQQAERPDGLRHSYINSILLSRQGELWIGTQAGLHRYQPRSDSFAFYGHESEALYGPGVNDVRVVFEDSHQRLWLGTANGLHQFHAETGKFTRYFIPVYPTRDGDSVVQAIAEDQDGLLWLGNHTGGLTSFAPAENRFRHYYHDAKNPNSISHNDVRAVFVDSKNNLWIGTHGGGLNKLGTDREHFQRLPYDTSNKSDLIWSIGEGPDGRIWIGDGGALGVMQPGEDHYHRYVHDSDEPGGPGNHVVNTLFMDRVQDIWVGYFPTGVDLVDQRASVFHNYRHDATSTNSVSDGGILATAEDARGNLWIGAGYGLSRLDAKRGVFTNFRQQQGARQGLSGDTVLAIALDQEENVWLGIWSRGLSRYNPQTGEFKHYRPEESKPRGLSGGEPWALTVDRDGVLWVATERGLNRYNRETDDFTHFLPRPEQIDGDRFFYTRALFEDSRRNLWVGSIRGLFRLDRATGEFQRFHHQASDGKSLSNDYVRAIAEDSHGALWVGTFGGGVNRFWPESGEFERYGREQGLPDEVVTSIVVDPAGAVWISTQKGLARFNAGTKMFSVFQQRHGLPGNLFNGNTGTLTSSGQLAFGSSKGLTLFDPARLQPNGHVPPVVITDFQIFNSAVAVGPGSPLEAAPTKASEVRLQYAQSVISFSFAALNFRSPEENQYSYMLEGFDEDWRKAGKQRNATYTNLDPGRYVFRVRGSNNDGLWNEQGAAVTVLVAPPLWRTWWAYAVYLGLAGLLFCLVLNLFLKKHAYEREHTLNQRLQELDALKDQFLANTSHELRTPLNGIIGLSESLLDGAAGPVPEPMTKHLQMIVFSGKRLANLVNDILDFSKLKTHSLQLNIKTVMLHAFVAQMLDMTRPLAGVKPLVLCNRVPDDLPPVLADENRLQQIFYNLLGNAIKFTDRGAITVTAAVRDKMLAVDVIDTGIGIPAEQIEKIFESFEQGSGTISRNYSGTGLGLAISKRLVELHGGTISVTSTEGSGSTFRITLPICSD